MSAPALVFRDVRKRYGRAKALDGLTFRVPAGSLYGLVGRNGAGKTTAIHIAAGLIHHQEGEVDVLGQGLYDPGVHRGRLSLLPQDAELPPHGLAEEILTFWARLQGLSRHAARRSVEEVLDWVHLTDRARAPIRTLSHGMRRRVMIAQAFLGQPELILLDEPLSGLDPGEVVHLRGILAERGGRQTIVISSHNLHEIALLCDHIAFLDGGRTLRGEATKTLTRQHRRLHYRVGAGEPPLDALRQAVPPVRWTLDPAGGRLSAAWEDEALTVPGLNRTVLPLLLDAGVEVYQVVQGSALEEVFMETTGQEAAPAS